MQRAVNESWYADIIEYLHETREYFQERADADHNGVSYVPNEEMRLQMAAQELLNQTPFARIVG